MNCRKNEQQIDIRITRILLSLGVPVSSKGFDYMRRCIIEAYYDKEITSLITKTLYPKVARLCKAENAGAVERTCRRMVTNALKRAEPDVWRRYFGVEPYKMNCAQFVSAIANYLRTEYEN